MWDKMPHDQAIATIEHPDRTALGGPPRVATAIVGMMTLYTRSGGWMMTGRKCECARGGGSCLQQHGRVFGRIDTGCQRRGFRIRPSYLETSRPAVVGTDVL